MKKRRNMGQRTKKKPMSLMKKVANRKRTIKKLKSVNKNRIINHVQIVNKEQVEKEEPNSHHDSKANGDENASSKPMMNIEHSTETTLPANKEQKVNEELNIPPSASIQLDEKESAKLMEKFNDVDFESTFNRLLKENNTAKLVELLTEAGIEVHLIYKK